MKMHWLVLACVGLMVGGSGARAALDGSAGEPESEDTVTGTIALVQFHIDAAEDAPAAIARHGGRVRHTFRLVPGLYTVRTPADPTAFLKSICDETGFMRAGLNAPVVPQSLPDDPSLAAQPTWAQIGMPAAWDWNVGPVGADAVVAVVDGGAVIQHEDLAANTWINTGEIPRNGVDDDGNGFIDDTNGWNFVAWSDVLADYDGHGTRVAGIVGGVGNNGVGITGGPWRCRMMSLPTLRVAEVAEALDYAVMNGARVSNHSYTLSASGMPLAPILYSVMAAACARGHLMICSAGCRDDGCLGGPMPDPVGTPARFDLDCIVSVGAVGSDGSLLPTSPFSETEVDLAGPGAAVLSTKVPWLPSDPWQYATFGGTSMATAHVTAVATLLWSVNPALSAAQVKALLLSTTTPHPSLVGTTVTGGTINAAAAVRTVSPARFEVLAHLPKPIDADTAYPIRIRLSPVSSAVVAGSVRLRLRLNGAWADLPMTPEGDEVYSTLVTVSGCHYDVAYYFEAELADLGMVRLGGVDELNPYRTDTGGSAVVHTFTDDFDADRGWTVGSDTDTATAGRWVREICEDDAYPGHVVTVGRAFVTDGRLGFFPHSTDVDGGSTTLTSPAIDLSGSDRAEVCYLMAFRAHDYNGASSSDDFIRVEVTGDGGTTWRQIDGLMGQERRYAWGGELYRRRAVTLTSPTELTPQTRFRFVISDEGAATIVDAGVDRFEVIATRCAAACIGDFDDNGAVTIQDIFDFLGAWFATQSTADVDRNGSVTVQDIFTFLGSWFGGC